MSGRRWRRASGNSTRGTPGKLRQAMASGLRLQTAGLWCAVLGTLLAALGASLGT